MLYPTFIMRMLIASLLLTTVAASYGQLLTSFLQNNFVNGIAHEKTTGNLLFVTSNGLWRFDGKDFVQVPIKIKAASGVFTLPPEELTDVAIDRDNRIWVSSKKNGLFINMGTIWKHVTSDSGAPSNFITDIFVDSRWQMWIGTEDQGVGVFDGQRWHRMKIGEYAIFDSSKWIVKALLTDIQGPLNNHVNVIHEDNEKGIWIGSAPGARRFSGGLDSAGITQQLNWCFNCLDSFNVLAFANGPDGKLWAGTSGRGVVRLQPGCNFICTDPEAIPAADDPLKNKTINAIEVDLEGNLWFGTNDDGVYRYNPPAGSFRDFNENDFPGLRTVNAVFKDPDNNLWFGLSENQGAVRLNNNWFTFDHDSLPNPFVVSLLAVKDTLWVGTANGIRRFKGEARLGQDILRLNRAINALAPAGNSQVWVGTFGSGVYLCDANGNARPCLNLDPTGTKQEKNQIYQIIQRQQEVWIAAENLLSRVRAPDCSLIETYSRESTQSGLFDDRIRAIAFDKTGRLWCGTPVGVSVYDPDKDEWIGTFTKLTGLFEDDNVTAIAANPINGEVWVGTYSGGISIYDGVRWTTHLDRRTVLADNLINEIVFSSSGEVFVATPRGVNRRDHNGIWSTFDFQSGLASDNVAAIALQGDSLRWFGTYGAGLTKYRPPQTLPQNFEATQPQTFIETRFDVTDKSEITYRFSAADLNTAPNEFRYRYWLDSQTPSEPTSDRFALVQGIEPGPHTFYVQAIDRDGNLDPTPDADFFTRIDPGKGGSSIHQDSMSFSQIGKIAVNVYWPPNLLSKDTEINIAADTLAKSQTSALFAFELVSNAPFNRRKPMTLTFSFPDSAVRGKNLGIYKIEGQNKALRGGTDGLSNDGKTFSISTTIQELGVYGMGERPVDQATLPDSAQFAYHANVQPRIFSPRGGGHSEQATISFKLERSEHVRVQVYNLAGRLIDTIWNEAMNAGVNAVAWNGRDKHGQICPSGLYLITIESSGFLSPPKPVKVMVLNQ